MRTYIYRFALALLLLSGLMACTRNEAPQRRSNSRSSVDHPHHQGGLLYRSRHRKELTLMSGICLLRNRGTKTINTSRFIILHPASSTSMVWHFAPQHSILRMSVPSLVRKTSSQVPRGWKLSRTSLAVGKSILSSPDRRSS